MGLRQNYIQGLDTSGRTTLRQTPKERMTNLPPGALPTTTLPTPRYTPLNPPAWTKPCEDWRRVLRVSIGKNNKSTDVPAAPPAYPRPSKLHFIK